MKYIPILLLLMHLLFSDTANAQKWPVYTRKGMVVSTHYLASEVGLQTLKAGGNAVDAAVATGFALAVVNPGAGNLGGGGFMMIRLADGTCTGIDYREKAPKAAHEKMYLDTNGQLITGSNHFGYKAVAVPGTVAGLLLALEKFGTMTPAEVINPAIALAENGFPLSYALEQDFINLEDEFKQYPGSAKKFYKPDGSYYRMGDIWRQPDLASTLKRIAKNGKAGFYADITAKIFEKEMTANGGLITAEDLADYEAKFRAPIEVYYRGYTVYSMAPPSSGGITLGMMLNILENYDLAALGHNSAAYVHLLAEAMRRAYKQRAMWLGDPDFNPDIPVEKLISQKFANVLAETIDLSKASKSDSSLFFFPNESEYTTHFSVVDSQGNAVSNTFTLEYYYGSRIVLNGLGFLLNNEMGDFNPVPGLTNSKGLIGSPPNLIQPGKRMLSSMTPTIVTKNGKNYFLIGSPGGRTIINTVLQCIINVIDFNMNVFEAIDAPRFHHQWLPDKIRIEQWGVGADAVEKLQEMGHTIDWYRTKGRAMGILIDHKNGVISGAADPRSPDGAAVGY
jgi:gamma-glutamyltranspeptidase/glutathione hydrolase